MKTLTIVAVALAGLSGILVLWQGGRISELEAAIETQADRSPGKREAPAQDRGFGDDEDLLRSLQARVSRLEAELAVSRTRTGSSVPETDPVPGTEGAVPGEAVAEIREQVDALLVGEALETDEARARLKELVQETRQQERQERMDRWQEMRKEETREELQRFAEEHDLSNQQVQEISTLMDTEMTAMTELFTAAREGDRSHREIRTEVRSLRESTDQQARSMLDEDQYAGYEAMRDEMGGPGRGRRRGR